MVCGSAVLRILFVDSVRIEHPLRDHLITLGRDLAVEAALITFVAGGSRLLNLEQDGVLVAIDIDGLHLLHMPALLSFVP